MPKECPGNQRKQHGGNIEGRDTAPPARCRNPEGRRLVTRKKAAHCINQRWANWQKEITGHNSPAVSLHCSVRYRRVWLLRRRRDRHSLRSQSVGRARTDSLRCTPASKFPPISGQFLGSNLASICVLGRQIRKRIRCHIHLRRKGEIIPRTRGENDSG